MSVSGATPARWMEFVSKCRNSKSVDGRIETVEQRLSLFDDLEFVVYEYPARLTLYLHIRAFIHV